MRIIWIRFLPHRDGHSAFQLTLQVLEAPLFPWASCRILIPLKSNCKSFMNYDLVSKIVRPCAIHLTHMMCLSIFGNDWWKTFFLISLCFFILHEIFSFIFGFVLWDCLCSLANKSGVVVLLQQSQYFIGLKIWCKSWEFTYVWAL